MKRILFLCSGNYYRSRFAEILFNHLAEEAELEWKADSRGIVADLSHNPGPIAEATRRGLAARNIPLGTPRYPMQLTDDDLVRADRVIALYDDEHRPMLRQHFPQTTAQIEYWLVPDLDEMPPEQALARIEENVHRLVHELAQTPVLL
jgi:protein-tyrosine phosphatase